MKRVFLALGLGLMIGLVAASITSAQRVPSSSSEQVSPLAFVSSVASPYDWPQFDFDARHSGNNTLEATIATSNVNSLARLFQITLPSIADGAPAYVNGVTTSSGVRDLVMVTTKAGHIIALDAHTGAQIWIHQYAAGACRINNGSTPCYTTSSPAIDPNRQYVYSYGLDGRVHKYQVGDGTEISSGGWPEITTRKAFDEKGSSALSVATANSNNYLYVTNGGYPGDRGDYQGHITAINLADGSQNVFNALCSNQAVHFVETPNTPDCPSVQTAVWARAGVVYDSDTNKLYASTGNGDFNPASHYWGDTDFAINPDGTGSGGNPLDTYTPADFQQLQNSDADLGSTAPAVLPSVGGNYAHLGVQSGKDALIRLINLDNLSGQGKTGQTGGEIQILSVPQGGEVLTHPAVWTDPCTSTAWTFIANGGGISGLLASVDGSGNPSLAKAWQTGNGGSSPILANNVLYYAGSGVIRALSPLSGSVLWSDTTIGGIHWESPIVANGVLYITDESSHLTAYAPTRAAAARRASPLQGFTYFFPFIGSGCTL